MIDNGIPGVTRRTLLRSGAAALALSASRATLAQGQVPKRGGVLRLGIDGGSTTDTLDPRQLIGSFSVNVSRQIFNTLVQISDTGRPEPELALSWEAHDGNTRWVIDLRPDVVFHNGKTLMAEDVRYSIGMHWGRQSTSKAKALVGNIAEVKVINSTQIEVALTSPTPDLHYVLSDLHFAIVPDGWTDWANPVGTGPFKLREFTPAIRASTLRNEHYWKSGQPYVDGVETTVINDDTARLAALQSKNVHIVNGVNYKLAHLLARSHHAYLVVTEGKQHFALPMDARLAPFSDPDVAMALKHAIDREQMVRLLMAGYGRVGNDQPIAADDPDLNPNIPQRSYDPDKSRFYLKKAGRTDLTIELHAASAAFEQAIDGAVLYAESAKAAGITISVQREPNDGYWNRIWLKAPWSCSFWAGRPSASMIFRSVYLSTAPWNETHWINEQFDRRLRQALASADPATQQEIYFDLQQLIHDDCPTIIPAFASWVDAALNEVEGFVPNPNFMLSDHRVTERVWFAV